MAEMGAIPPPSDRSWPFRASGAIQIASDCHADRAASDAVRLLSA